MFDFEKFEVYKKAKQFAKDISAYLDSIPPKNTRIIDQLSRASLSIPLNIAEGAGRYSKADKRNFYTIARGSVFECVALIDILLDKNLLNSHHRDSYYLQLEELSKMLSGLINSQKS
ncbi:MAG: four helix bundle protein [bacterium]